jgi:hypothetical protein
LLTQDYHTVTANCTVCDGSGYLNGALCECLLQHRITVFMTSGGFSRQIIDFVSDPDYNLPYIDYGESSLTKYLSDPEKVLDRGLGLYICSRDAGRGKTVLSHYIVSNLCRYFMNTANYRSGMKFAFQSSDDFLTNSLSYSDDKLWMSDVYVLDDLGNENRATKQRRDAVVPALQKILQYRRNQCLPTIFTSNYTPESVGALYSGRLDSLMEIGVDGIIEGNLFRQIEVGGGEDLRTLKSAWDD